MNKLEKYPKEKREIIKKTVILFKKFARKYGFWEKYKKNSKYLNNNNNNFIDLIAKIQPCYIINHTSLWLENVDYSKYKKLIYKWRDICIKEKLFYGDIGKKILEKYEKDFINC